MAENLPGVDFPQDQLDVMLLHAPYPEATWYDWLLSIHPHGLAEVPIWYVTIVQRELQAGRITDAQARSLLSADAPGFTVSPPRSLLSAWDDLMQSFAVTWPKRRKAASAQILRMNTAVTHAQRKFSRG